MKSIKRTIKKYCLLAVVFLAIAGAAYWGIGYMMRNDGVAFLSSESEDITPAVLDSIKSIGQWELASIDLTVDIDTVQKRWFGLSKKKLTRRYYGTMSVGIDMAKLSTTDKDGKEWYHRDKDTIYVELPEVCLLDSNFIDESRTKLILSEDNDLEQDATVKADMLARAHQRMLRDGIPHKTFTDIHRRVTSDIVTRFQDIGYKKVVVTFD